MSPEKEELLTDPGNHAVLKYLAGAEERKLQETAEATGMEEERLQEKAEVLQQRGFVEKNHSPEGVKLQLSRENLEGFREEIEQFVDGHASGMNIKATQEKQSLRNAREKLEQQKEDTSVLKKEKAIEKKIEAVDTAIEKLEDLDKDNMKGLEAFSYAHRIQRFLGERDSEFHSFNPGRKIKAMKKIDEVLDEQPEEREERRFFGNRWVTRDQMEQD